MNVSMADEGGETLVIVSGEVDADNCSEFGATVLGWESIGESVVIDMSDVAFIDSSGVSELLNVHRELVDKGMTVTMAKPSPSVYRVLEITGLLDVLGID